MMMTDPISNMLTVIRNAISAPDSSKHRVVSVPSSKELVKIAEILMKNGYIEKYRITEEVAKKPKLEMLLVHTGKSSILGLKRVSKPGLRMYTKHKELPTVLNGYGIAIISTSKGLMTNKQAKKLGLGGEVIAYVW
ncbi:30S ribosomal protein S8 [Spiroplasma sp. AdecLV25b]|uniref:30S ribosomal protein S8 n=1 Tax=Spiroplasma sp. AdecLV25b TaxID=3027162 RepID=UPI0027E05DF6|nr:30S ribosomal protein S8 [Spiroplasma sp. AdecLV25b]